MGGAAGEPVPPGGAPDVGVRHLWRAAVDGAVGVVPRGHRGRRERDRAARRRVAAALGAARDSTGRAHRLLW